MSEECKMVLYRILEGVAIAVVAGLLSGSIAAGYVAWNTHKTLASRIDICGEDIHKLTTAIHESDARNTRLEAKLIKQIDQLREIRDQFKAHTSE